VILDGGWWAVQSVAWNAAAWPMVIFEGGLSVGRKGGRDASYEAITGRNGRGVGGCLGGGCLRFDEFGKPHVLEHAASAF
jgi:hypothetical protein